MSITSNRRFNGKIKLHIMQQQHNYYNETSLKCQRIAFLCLATMLLVSS